MDPNANQPRAARTLGRASVAALAVGGVLLLGALIVHELMPHHAAAHAATVQEEVPVETTAANAPAAPAPVARAPVAAPVAAAPAVAAPPPPAAAAAVPLAATIISQLVANPESFAPSNVFAPPVAKTEMFHYETLPPFNSTELKRNRANPKVWELSAMHGPKMDDLGPAGGVREAAVVKDDIGNQTSWYAIESGPLAPSYAVKTIMGVRVMSREFVEANRADFPREVAALLDK